MLSLESVLKVADNSGIKSVKCLKFLDGFSQNKKGTLGNIVVVSLFNYKGFSNKSSRKVYIGIIVTIKKWFRRKTGIFIRSNQNRIILLDTIDKMLGKAIKGPVSIEVRKQNITRVLFLAKTIY